MRLYTFAQMTMGYFQGMKPSPLPGTDEEPEEPDLLGIPHHLAAYSRRLERIRAQFVRGGLRRLTHPAPNVRGDMLWLSIELLHARTERTDPGPLLRKFFRKHDFPANALEGLWEAVLFLESLELRQFVREHVAYLRTGDNLLHAVPKCLYAHHAVDLHLWTADMGDYRHPLILPAYTRGGPLSYVLHFLMKAEMVSLSEPSSSKKERWDTRLANDLATNPELCIEVMHHATDLGAYDLVDLLMRKLAPSAPRVPISLAKIGERTDPPS